MNKSILIKAMAIILALCIFPACALAATIEMAYGGGSLYLREGPGREYDDNGTVQDGASITVLSYGEIWSKVRTSDGRVGYIKNLYINDGDDTFASGTDYFSSRYSIYTTANVNMRAGASTATAVIRTLPRGTRLTAMGKNGSFHLVQTAEGVQGYVYSSYLSRNQVSGGSNTSVSLPDLNNTKTVTASYVNMRAGGGLSYEVVKVLPRGTVVTVLQQGNYWTYVNYKGTRGWIKNTYLK